VTPTDAADTAHAIVATTARPIAAAPEGAGSALRHHTMSGGRAPTPVRNCIGVVVTDAPEGLLLDPYYSTIFKGISGALAERSKLFMLMAPMSDSELYATRRLLIGTQVDGLILIGLHTDSWLPQFIRRRRIPAVMCGHPPADFGVSGVDCDNYKGAVMAVDHLLAAGRRRIAHVSGNLETPSGLDRRTGYRDALAAAGVPCDATWEALGNFHHKPARVAMERLLKNHPDLDGVFVASDEMAVVVMDVLTTAGRRIPDDVAVVGFDDSPCAARASLSTVRQSIEQTGRMAVEMLTAQIADPAAPPKLLVLDVELIVRESTTGAGGPVTDG
jgi:DNA-binding LacI/PurR family transcriptional regulator